MEIISIKEKIEFKQSLISYIEKNWPAVKDFFTEQLEVGLSEEEKVQQTFIMIDNDAIVGFYQFLKHEPIQNQGLTPWIGTLFIDEGYRGMKLSEKFLIHGRKYAGKLGFDKVYLSTDHIQLYEKFGFEEIGLDIDKWGYPTKIYVNDSIK